MHEGRLVLGSFQGNPACIHIEIGKGVCGTAVQEKRIIRVPFLPADGSEPPADPAAAFGFTMPGVTYPQLNFRPWANKPIRAIPILCMRVSMSPACSSSRP